MTLTKCQTLREHLTTFYSLNYKISTILYSLNYKNTSSFVLTKCQTLREHKNEQQSSKIDQKG